MEAKLAYGMGAAKLSRSMGSTLPEAEKLIEDYFKVFPKIGGVLKYFGNFGVRNGYIKTIAPFFRRRYFPEWKDAVHNINYHLMGVDYDPILGAIERQSKNVPIQGSSADSVKVILFLVRRFINDNRLRDKIKLVCQIHDALDSVCVEELQDWWKGKLTELMEEGAKFIITNGLLKAETSISPFWSK